jgi:hypothetical protein
MAKKSSDSRDKTCYASLGPQRAVGRPARFLSSVPTNISYRVFSDPELALHASSDIFSEQQRLNLAPEGDLDLLECPTRVNLTPPRCAVDAMDLLADPSELMLDERLELGALVPAI